MIEPKIPIMLTVPQWAFLFQKLNSIPTLKASEMKIMFPLLAALAEAKEDALNQYIDGCEPHITWEKFS